MSRYRLKIQSLEAENIELKEDLKMMEQERLRSWQIQVSLVDLKISALVPFVSGLGRTRGFSKEEFFRQSR